MTTPTNEKTAGETRPKSSLWARMRRLGFKPAAAAGKDGQDEVMAEKKPEGASAAVSSAIENLQN